MPAYVAAGAGRHTTRVIQNTHQLASHKNGSELGHRIVPTAVSLDQLMVADAVCLCC